MTCRRDHPGAAEGQRKNPDLARERDFLRHLGPLEARGEMNGAGLQTDGWFSIAFDDDHRVPAGSDFERPERIAPGQRYPRFVKDHGEQIHLSARGFNP